MDRLGRFGDVSNEIWVPGLGDLAPGFWSFLGQLVSPGGKKNDFLLLWSPMEFHPRRERKSEINGCSISLSPGLNWCTVQWRTPC